MAGRPGGVRPDRHHGDATSEIYSVLVEEEGTASTFRALKQVFTDKGMPSASTPTVAATTSTPPRQAARSPDQHTQRPSARPHIAAYSPEARGRSERAFGTLQDRSRNWRSIATVEAADASSQTPTCPTTIAASPPRPSSTTAPSWSAPTRSPSSACTQSASRAPCWECYERRVLQIPAARHHYVKAGSVHEIQTEPSPSSTGPEPRATPPTASPSKPQPGKAA